MKNSNSIVDAFSRTFGPITSGLVKLLFSAVVISTLTVFLLYDEITIAFTGEVVMMSTIAFLALGAIFLFALAVVVGPSNVSISYTVFFVPLSVMLTIFAYTDNGFGYFLIILSNVVSVVALFKSIYLRLGVIGNDHIETKSNGSSKITYND